MKILRSTQLALLIASLLIASSLHAQTEMYDIVFKQGRVIDPETNLDGIRYVGINGNKIDAVSEAPLRGRSEIDVAGKVLGPGFVDLHTHAMNV